MHEASEEEDAKFVIQAIQGGRRFLIEDKESSEDEDVVEKALHKCAKSQLIFIKISMVALLGLQIF